MSDRKIFIGEIGECPASIESFQQAVGDSKRIHLVINSAGGKAELALAMFEVLKGRHVTAEVRTRCFSAAVVVLLAAQTISMAPEAQLMVHPVVSFCKGGYTHLRYTANRVKKAQDRIAQLLAERCELPASITRQWLAGPTDKYFTAAEAVSLGLADCILPPEKPKRKRKLATVKAISQEPTRTEAEELFFSVLNAFHSLEVKDRAAFNRNLAVWLTCNVREPVCFPHGQPGFSAVSGLAS